MKAYKASRNLKCESLTYEVGKTYSIDSMKICHHGFHFCKKKEDVLSYYIPDKDFVLMEVEILGQVIDEYDKSVTDKIKVLRIIPLEEHQLFETDSNGNITEYNGRKYEYDSQNNKIKYESSSNGSWRKYEYDSQNNKIRHESLYGFWEKWEYDSQNNKIRHESSYGYWKKWEYDDRNNMIQEETVSGSWEKYEYDSQNNKIKYEDSSGYWEKYEYDSQNNLIKQEKSNGSWQKYEYDSQNNIIKYENSNGRKWKISLDCPLLKTYYNTNI